MKFQQFLQFRQEVQSLKEDRTPPSRKELIVNSAFSHLYDLQTLKEAEEMPLEKIQSLDAGVNEGIFGTLIAWMKLQSLLPKYAAALKASALKNDGGPADKPEKTDKPEGGKSTSDNPKVKAAEEKLNNANTALTTAKAKLKELQDKKDPAATEDEIKTAQEEVTKAQQAVKAAKKELADAKAAAADDEETGDEETGDGKTDGKGKEGAAKTQQDVEAAEGELQKAKDELSSLEKKDPPATDEEKTKAQEKVTAAQEKLDTAKKALTDAQAAEKLETFEQEVTAARAKKDEADQGDDKKAKLVAEKALLIAEAKLLDAKAKAAKAAGKNEEATGYENELKKKAERGKEIDKELASLGGGGKELTPEEKEKWEQEIQQLKDAYKKIPKGPESKMLKLKAKLEIAKKEALYAKAKGDPKEIKKKAAALKKAGEALLNAGKTQNKPKTESATPLIEDEKAQEKAEDAKVKELSTLIDNIAQQSGSTWIQNMAKNGKIEAEIAKQNAIIKAAKSESDKKEAEEALSKLEKKQKDVKQEIEDTEEDGGEDPKEQLAEDAKKKIKADKEKIAGMEEERDGMTAEEEAAREEMEKASDEDKPKIASKLTDILQKKIKVTEEIKAIAEGINDMVDQFELGEDEKRSIEELDKYIKNRQEELDKLKNNLVDQAEEEGIDAPEIKAATAEDQKAQQEASEAMEQVQVLEAALKNAKEEEKEELETRLEEARADFEKKKENAIEVRKKLNDLIAAAGGKGKNNNQDTDEAEEPSTQPPAPSKILKFADFMEKKKKNG